MADYDVSYSNDVGVSSQAVLPGPLYLEIISLRTVQPSGSFTNDNVIVKGESFDIIMKVLFRDVLSQLQVKYLANINVLNLQTGNKAATYSFEATDTLPGGGVQSMTLRKTFKASETGIFLLSGSLGFPTSKLFDFSLGSVAGSEPPIPAGPRLRIANFFVFDPDA